MKFLSSFALTILLFNVFAQDISFASNATNQEILTTLFEGTWSSSFNECKWKPNVAEKMKSGVSYDGFLYTSVDSVFNYNTSSNKYILIITSTKERDSWDSYQSCHVCAPSMSFIQLIFNEQSGKYELEVFEKFVTKYGDYGEPPIDISLLLIRKDVYCLKVVDEWIGQGYTIETTSLFLEGKEILSFRSHEDNLGNIYDENESSSYQFSTNLYIDSENGKLLLSKIGTEMLYEGESSYVENVNEVLTYELKNNELEKTCK